VKNDQHKQKFEFSGVEKPKEFTVKAGAKLFRTIIDGLYSSPHLAIIRELSCNAWDIHKQIGKENVPFKIKLPSSMDLNLIIRDFGTGLTKSQMENVYTKIFESTKEDSDELIGGFGLGSKTPLTIYDSFVVNSYIKGTKHCYFIITNDEGCPAYTPAGSFPTDEPDGLEIIIGTKHEDINYFCEAAEKVFKYFPVKPIISGNSNYKSYPLPDPVLSGKNWAYYESSERPKVIMGNVAYSLDKCPFQHNLLLRGLVLYFNIGEVAIPPSREDLLFNKKTIQAIETRLAEIEASITQEIESKISNAPTYWDAAIIAGKLNRFGVKNVVYKGINALQKINLAPEEQFHEIVSGRRYEYSVYYITPCHHDQMPKFFIDDLKRGGKSRIRDYAKFNKNQYYLIELSRKDKIKKALHLEDSQISLTSSLRPVTRTSRSRISTSHSTKVMKLVYANNSATGCWEDCSVDLKNDGGLFFEISNNRIFVNGKSYHPSKFYLIAKQFNLEVYGIKKSALKDLGPKWINAADKMKSLCEKYVDKNKHIKDAQETVYQINWSMDNLIHCINSFKKKFKKPNELTIVADTIKGIQDKLSNDHDKLSKLRVIEDFLLDIWDISPYNGVANPIVKNLEVLSKKYPLLLQVHDEEMYYYASYILEKGRI
jgi:hypothetical protein